jgi:hypothetical protein
MIKIFSFWIFLGGVSVPWVQKEKLKWLLIKQGLT